MSEFADVNISLVNDCWIKQLHFKQAGWVAQTHAHTFDHQTLLATGSLLVTVDGESIPYTAPCIMVIRAGTKHRMEALEDNTVAYCVHPLRQQELVVGHSNEALHGLL